ncbi:MAG: integrase family protein [Candidatus Obscuribacterales bacterium]|nr:integrase family protein [Candidatus Obscuribacterales bacterium]
MNQNAENIRPLTDHFAENTTAVGEWRDKKLPGFRFKVTAAGNKVWFVENLLAGTRKSVTLTIGRWPAVKVDEARLKAIRLLSELRQGIDPRLEQKRRQKIQEAEWAAEKQVQKLTLSSVLTDYLNRKNLKEGTIDNYRSVANAYLSDWMNRLLTGITKDDVESRFNQITNREIGSAGKGGPGAANNTMRVLRALFTFAQEMYEMPDGTPVVLYNPVKRLNQLNSWNKLKRRQTMLSEIDLPLWYQALCNLEDKAMADYFLFVLLTGLRKNEAARLKWDDVHTKRGYFEILNTKNKLEFALPITDRLKEILDRRAKARKDKANPYVFAADGKTGRFDLRGTHFKLISDQTKVPFGLHDLRRTYLTQGFLMGQDLEMLKKLANHKSNDSEDVTKGYLIVKVNDMKEPMEKVGDRLWDMMTRKTKRKIAAS